MEKFPVLATSVVVPPKQVNGNKPKPKINVGVEAPLPKVEKIEFKASARLRTIYTPAGECPVKLTDFSDEGIINWAKKVYEHGINNGQKYLPEAICYFLTMFLDNFSPTYKRAKRLIMELF